MTQPIPQGSTLGILGGGQLGRMFTDAAHRLGYKVHVYCPEADCPASQVADMHTRGRYDDLGAVAAFAASVSVVTYEFENVPAATAATCARHVPVRPGERVLRVAQDRLAEKSTLRSHGIPVGPFAPVHSEDELHAALKELGCPAVLKTSTGGYDGKGQRVLHSAADVTYAWAELGSTPCILEAFVDFEQEVSVVTARDLHGNTATYGPIANTHRNHILDISVVPSGAPGSVEAEALRIARDIMVKLDVVGVLCVEFFQTRPSSGKSHGGVLVNELAPRPHNSGHLTMDAYSASQFEQQVRAVCGLPLADVRLRGPAAMVNLLGDLWPPPAPGNSTAPGSKQGKHGEPDWSIVNGKNLHLHLYGKHAARPGRKMGHLTALARTPHEAIRDAVEARAKLAPRHAIAPD